MLWEPSGNRCAFPACSLKRLIGNTKPVPNWERGTNIPNPVILLISPAHTSILSYILSPCTSEHIYAWRERPKYVWWMHENQPVSGHLICIESVHDDLSFLCKGVFFPFAGMVAQFAFILLWTRLQTDLFLYVDSVPQWACRLGTLIIANSWEACNFHWENVTILHPA